MSLIVGIRLHKRDSIFKRISALIKSGVLEYEKRPLWYDVYEKFPPITEPVYKPESKPNDLGLPSVVDDVREILYTEDWARAIAYNKMNYIGFTNIDPAFEGSRNKKLNNVEKFLSIYQELEKEKETVSKTELFFKAEEIFNQEYSKISAGKKKLKKVEEIEKDEFKEE